MHVSFEVVEVVVFCIIRPSENDFEEQVYFMDCFRPGEKFFAQVIWQLRSGEDNVAQAKMALEQVCSLEYFCPSKGMVA